MNHFLTYAWRYLKFYFKAQGIQNVHSPFVFDLLSNVVFNKTPYYFYKPIEQFRNLLLLNHETIHIEDFGAGSKYGNSKNKKVGDIARTALKKPKYAQLLFRLALHQKPEVILELGTSLGLSSIYLSYAHKDVEVITIEGSKEIAEVAQQNFKQLKRKNIRPLVGKFEDVLPGLLKERSVWDFVFIDGHHAELPTKEYFNLLVKQSNENALFILDDIHWSEGMEHAWKEIQGHEAVTLTIDLFEMGLVFFMKRKQKEHFRIRF